MVARNGDRDDEATNTPADRRIKRGNDHGKR
jgi:hypothetical protein